VARKQRSAHIKAALVKVPGEVAKRLWGVAEPMNEEYSPRVAGPQVNRTCTFNYVCYRNRSKFELLLLWVLRSSRLPGQRQWCLLVVPRRMKAGCQLLGINNKARTGPCRHPTAHHPTERQGYGLSSGAHHLA